LIVDSFPTPEDSVDDGIIEFGIPVFDMVGTDCAKVALSHFDFDSFDEVSDPVCNGFDCSGERVIAVGSGEESIIGDGFVVSFPS